jgi:RNAse (barnase) inhibitor barstar
MAKRSANAVRQSRADLDRIVASERTAGPEVFVVDLAAARSKRDLMEALRRTLLLPGHFGANWDALADCLMDADWLPAAGASIVLTGTEAFRRAAGPDWRTLLEILEEAAAFWAGKDRPFRATWR